MKAALAFPNWLKRLQLASRSTAPVIGLVVLAISLLGYRLGSISRSLSPIETNAVAVNGSLRAIGGAPLNLPYKLLDYLFLQLPIGSLAVKARLAGVVVALGCSILFYLIVRRWYGAQNALMAAFLFATSGWILHTGRFGSGLILISCMILAVMAVACWINASGKDTDHRLVVPAASLVFSAALFVPGGLWFVVAALLLLSKKLLSHVKNTAKGLLVLSGSIGILAVIAIAAALVHHPDQALQWLGVPDALPSLALAGKYAAGSAVYLIAHGPYIPELWLAHTPVLDAATAGLLLLGTAFYIRHWESVRVRLLAAFLLISIALLALNGPYALAYLVPLVYLIVATGLVYLLHQWNVVFPRNPIARSLALVLVASLLLTAAAYHVQRYFIAWQSSPDTRQAYHAQRSEIPLNLLQ